MTKVAAITGGGQGIGRAIAYAFVDAGYASFHRDARAGIFPIDWAGNINTKGEFGEVR